jgi:hypothetical protein
MNCVSRLQYGASTSGFDHNPTADQLKVHRICTRTVGGLFLPPPPTSTNFLNERARIRLASETRSLPSRWTAIGQIMIVRLNLAHDRSMKLVSKFYQ